VPKPDGTIRFYVDFCHVNDITIPDAFPLTWIEDLIDHIDQAKFLTKIDLLRGYWQVPLDADAIQISAFVTTHGL
jgi:hypothetical protein